MNTVRISRTLILCLLLTSVIALNSTQARQRNTALLTGRKPNIVYILADDLGWGDARVYNPQSQIPTPNLNNQEKKVLVNGPLYPFGHGLSYTTYAYSNLQIAPATRDRTGTIQVSLDVQNTGTRAGDEIVQLYLSPDVTSVVYYDSVLRGFERVSLKPGEKTSVRFTLSPQDLMILNRDMQWVVEPGRYQVWIGASSEDIRLRGSFNIR